MVAPRGFLLAISDFGKAMNHQLAAIDFIE
jgi:hypothetical protein